ncbi:MAG: hypothetical protein D6800_07690, partial [Candidatus Zixiibacteriota bacterium]
MSLFGRIISFNLRTKFIVPIATMMVVGMVVVSTYLIKRQSEGYLRELETSGYTMIQMVAINSESGVLFESRYELKEILTVLSRFDGVEFAIIRNREGDILAQTGVYDPDTNTVVRDLISKPLDPQTTGHYYRDPVTQEVLVLTAPVVTHKRNISREQLGMGGFSGSTGAHEVVEQIGTVQLGLAVQPMIEKIEEAKALAILL